VKGSLGLFVDLFADLFVYLFAIFVVEIFADFD
jgi:hypothetical protein